MSDLQQFSQDEIAYLRSREWEKDNPTYRFTLYVLLFCVGVLVGFALGVSF